MLMASPTLSKALLTLMETASPTTLMSTLMATRSLISLRELLTLTLMAGPTISTLTLMLMASPTGLRELSTREGTVDTDNDGRSNYVDIDSDNDGILDSVEGNVDTDGDSIPNYLDLDSDDDGIADSVEGSADRDGDGEGNYIDLDSDNDGIIDAVERSVDTDADGVPNYLDLDSDNDALSDAFESGYTGHANRDNYRTSDSDGDGVADEVDSTPTVWGATQSFSLVNTDGDSAPDYLDLDSDNNGVFDIRQRAYLPISYDTNNNGRVDGIDADGDGILGRADTCTCFGGLVVRGFDIITPRLNTRWLMYSSNAISWAHNLVADYNTIRIDLFNVSTGVRRTLFDKIAIGTNNRVTQTRSWTVSGLNTGRYTIIVSLYVGTTMYPDVFTSPQFNIST
eukprot:TRINITY_DN300_c0_g1_i3.p1 TRINITY_DN300_c0_g1~~TRINITY_DN300_c0_g1_i3.p1  ORF type:complete len:397 (-),score=152.25 TRINITY_DN300_c0_g1_i3:106-1296(-)